MTEEMKSNMLKYLVGKMPQQTGTNEPQFEDVIQINKTIKGQIASHIKYKELEYIESTGTEYIDTGINCTTNGFRITGNFEWLSYGSGYSAICGVQQTANSNSQTCCNIIRHNNYRFYALRVGNKSTTTLIDIRLNEVATIDSNMIKGSVRLQVNDQYVSDTESNNRPDNKPIYLFALNNGGSPGYYSTARIYHCKIYDENNELVGDFVPVRDPSGLVGLYNKVDGSFKTYLTGENTTSLIGGEETGIEYSIPTNKIKLRHSSYNSNFNMFMLCGTTTEKPHNFISLFDERLNLIQFIDKFDSGSNMYDIRTFIQDSDGNIYAYSLDTNTSTQRLLYLNNVYASGSLTGYYKVSIKKSYIVPTSTNFTIAEYTTDTTLIKQDSTYYVIGHNTSSDTTILKIGINVGSENTWDTYSLSSNNLYFSQAQAIATTNSYKIYGIDYIAGKYMEATLTDSISITKQITLNSEDASFNFFYSGVALINDSNVYAFLVISQSSPYKFKILKFGSSSYSTIYSYSSTNIPLGLIKVVNNKPFIKLRYKQNDDYIHKIGIMLNDVIYWGNETEGYTGESLSSDMASVFIINNYNLYNIMYNAGEYSSKNLLVYNDNNYNGEPFIDEESLFPNSSVLRDNNEDIIFARNLYNKTISGSTTTSSVEIPNSMLNNITIKGKTLLSKNKNILNEETNQFTKNVYEKVNVNFINTWNMINNNTSSSVVNFTGATRINDSATNTLDYDDAKATKYKINYSDGTNAIMSFQSTQIKITSLKRARYEFQVQVPSDKTITSIQIISNDEETIYQTINTSSMESNKTYNITQYVHIDTYEPSNVMYNNNQVQYNGNDVIY